jgi:hypothetical protein
MYSDPCQYKNSVYTRYNASETFQASPSLPPFPTHKNKKLMSVSRDTKFV